MHESSYVDREGRQFAVLLPDDVPDSQAHQGMPLGPPPLDTLNLPVQIEVRLNNELFNRRIFTYDEAKRRMHELQASIVAACKVDAMDVLALYNAPSLDEVDLAILTASREDDPNGIPEG